MSTTPLHVRPRSGSAHDAISDVPPPYVHPADSLRTIQASDDVAAIPSYPALPALASPTPAGLGQLAAVLATRGDLWRPVMHVDPDHRWFTRIAGGEGWEAWLLTWLPGQRTGLHDHGGAAGAFTVLSGVIREETASDAQGRRLLAGDERQFGPKHIHEVIGDGDGPAATLHVYAPVLTIMRRYERTASGVRLVSVEQEGTDW